MNASHLMAVALLAASMSLVAQAAGVLGQGTWETTLIKRDINGDSVIDAYYDTAQNITWLANADVIGRGNWNRATAWAANLNVHGVKGWRLPSTVDDLSSHGIDKNNPSFESSELGYLYWVTLANSTGPNFPLPNNTGPFSNVRYDDYWSGTTANSLGYSIAAWDFYFNRGGNNYTVDKSLEFPFAWAVRDGDTCGVATSDPLFFNNSVRIGPTQDDNRRMIATFTPGNGCTLGETAAAHGYDHFNWLQLVIGHPDPFLLNVPPGGGIPLLITTPFYDPVLGGGTLNQGMPADYFPFYWDESDTLNDLNANLLPFRDPLRPNTVLLFQDMPSWPGNSAADPLSFVTSLVGVYPDKTYDILDVFTWKSSYDADAGIGGISKNVGPYYGTGQGEIFDIVTRVSLDSLIPEVLGVYVGSGARNVRFMSVAESSTLALIVAALLSQLCTGVPRK